VEYPEPNTASKFLVKPSVSLLFLVITITCLLAPSGRYSSSRKRLDNGQNFLELLYDTEPKLPPVTAENNKGPGLIAIEGKELCVIEVGNVKRELLEPEKHSQKSSKLVKVVEGADWFGMITNSDLSTEEFEAEEEQHRKDAEMIDRAIQRQSQRIRLIDSGTRRV
jgi:hypothetical protein